MRTLQHGGRHLRQITTLAIATTFLTQNFAWAVCSDGLGFPAGNQGYVFSTLNTVAPTLANMTPNIFTATAGSVFIPDNSTFENNDPTNVSTVALNGSGIAGLPVAAVGGHNWNFDQGSTTCKSTSQGAGSPPLPPIPGQAPAGWNQPPNTTTDCFVLPVAKIQTITIVTNLTTGQVNFSSSVGTTCNGVPGDHTNGTLVTSISCSVTFSNFGVVPLTSQAIVTTCVSANLSTALAPNPANTRLNQLGCAISRSDTGVITDRDQTVAPAYMATASIMGGLFIERLENTPNSVVGDSGRVTADLLFMADTVGIPAGTKLTNAIISPDGQFVAATSIRRDPRFFGCFQPLGNPGRIDKPPVDLVTFAASQDTIVGVKCMSQIGTTGLQVTLANVWGPDNQPYLGGQRTITTAGTTGGNPGSFVSPSAWPQCIALGKGETFTLPAVYPAQTVPSVDRQSATFGNYDAVAQLDAAIADVFKNHKNGNCAFGPNSGLSASPVVQPQSIAVYQAGNVTPPRQYLFTSGTGQPVTQTRITQDAVGASHYATRTYYSQGTGLVTGVGVAPDMNFTTGGSVNTAGAPTPAAGATGSGSLIVMTDPSGLGLAAQEVMSRLPLCEDF
jgi:hypothetical protein